MVVFTESRKSSPPSIRQSERRFNQNGPKVLRSRSTTRLYCCQNISPLPSPLLQLIFVWQSTYDKLFAVVSDGKLKDIRPRKEPSLEAIRLRPLFAVRLLPTFSHSTFSHFFPFFYCWKFPSYRVRITRSHSRDIDTEFALVYYIYLIPLKLANFWNGM